MPVRSPAVDNHETSGPIKLIVVFPKAATQFVVVGSFNIFAHDIITVPIGLILPNALHTLPKASAPLPNFAASITYLVINSLVSTFSATVARNVFKVFKSSSFLLF